MYEHRRQKAAESARLPEATRPAGLFSALILVVVSLGIGTVGFHLLSDSSGSMRCSTPRCCWAAWARSAISAGTSGKLFASFFALYSGLVFLIVAGLLFMPVFHRVLHRFPPGRAGSNNAAPGPAEPDATWSLPDAVEWPSVRTTMSPSEMAGVAMITSFMSFFATWVSPGPAVRT